MSDIAPATAEVRLDAWLWAARFFKTRALARQAVVAGRVAVDGQPRKPAAAVRVGAQLRIVRGEEIFQVEVRALSVQRGPAPVAQALYHEGDASRQARELVRAQRRAEATGYRPPESKPDKRARRLLRALGDIDAM